MAAKKTNNNEQLATVHLKLPNFVRDALNDECESTEEGQGQVVARALEALLIMPKPKMTEGTTINDVERRLWVLQQRLRHLKPDEAQPSDTLLEVASGLDRRMQDLEGKFDDSQVKTLQTEITCLQTANTKLRAQLAALLAVESAPVAVEAAAS